jgi:hypothetical protein
MPHEGSRFWLRLPTDWDPVSESLADPSSAYSEGCHLVLVLARRFLDITRRHRGSLVLAPKSTAAHYITTMSSTPGKRPAERSCSLDTVDDSTKKIKRAQVKVGSCGTALGGFQSAG